MKTSTVEREIASYCSGQENNEPVRSTLFFASSVFIARNRVIIPLSTSTLSVTSKYEIWYLYFLVSTVQVKLAGQLTPHDRLYFQTWAPG